MVAHRVENDDDASRDLVLARAFEVLSSPVRLALLRLLRSPKTLREIEVKPPPGSEGPPGRNLARQTVRDHLDRLMGIGVVVTRPAARPHGETIEYLLNQQAVFALGEAFREVARLRSSSEPRLETLTQPRRGAEPVPRVPCLVLVKGLDEGRAFRLPAPPQGPASWVIGRRRGLAVSLDFDPFVSSEHALVVWRGGPYLVKDLPDNRNGTLLNFEPLPKDDERELTTGDLLSVGRSILMFRA